MQDKFNRVLYLVGSLFFLLQSLAVKAQTERFGADQYVSNQDTLRYRLLSPDYDTLRKYPLVIFLHGSGERGSDNQAQLKWGVMNFATDQAMALYHAFVLAPQCPLNMQWSNVSRSEMGKSIRLNATPARPMALLMELVQRLIKRLPIDTNRIYITGLSMGGFGTFDALERFPSLFAAAVPVCGGGDTSKASLIAHVPIWIFHGAEDPTVNPVLSINMMEALFRAGAHPGLTLYPETGHFSWVPAYSDPVLLQWLFSQHK